MTHGCWLLAASPRACLLPVACSLTACCLARSVALALGLCGSGLLFVFCEVTRCTLQVAGCRMQDGLIAYCLLLHFHFHQPAASHQPPVHQPPASHQAPARQQAANRQRQRAASQEAGSRQQAARAASCLQPVCCLLFDCLQTS